MRLEGTVAGAGFEADQPIAVFDGSEVGSRAVRQLAVAAILSELRSRHPSGTYRVYTLEESGSSQTLEGEPIYPLLPWTAAKAERLSASVVLGSPGLSAAAVGVTDGISVAGGHVSVVAMAPAGPDPTSVVWRLFDPDKVRIGPPEAGGAYLLSDVAAGTGPERAVEALGRRLGLSVERVSPDVGALDLIAALGGAGLVVSDSPAVISLAVGYLRPALLVTTAPARSAPTTPPGAALARSSDEILAFAGRPPEAPTEEDRQERSDAADAAFDALAATLQAVSGRRAAMGAEDRLVDLCERVAALESVNAGLRRQLAQLRDRRVKPSDGQAARLDAAVHESARRVAAADVATAQAQLNAEAAERQAEQLRQEVARIYATRTMRVVRPARAIYSRVRSALR